MGKVNGIEIGKIIGIDPSKANGVQIANWNTKDYELSSLYEN